MKIKFFLFFLILSFLLFCLICKPVFATDVTNWTELDTAVFNGDSNIVIKNNNIFSPGTVITNNSLNTAISNSAAFYISGSGLNTVFRNNALSK